MKWFKISQSMLFVTPDTSNGCRTCDGGVVHDGGKWLSLPSMIIPYTACLFFEIGTARIKSTYDYPYRL
jgi:hypothetical protein